MAASDGMATGDVTSAQRIFFNFFHAWDRDFHGLRFQMRASWVALVAGGVSAVNALVPSGTPPALRASGWLRAAVTRESRRSALPLVDGHPKICEMRSSFDGAEAARNAEELKTGVQLRSQDFGKLCDWVTEEITLWLDQEWIQRDVHREMGQRAAESVRRMVVSGNAAVSAILFAVAEDLGAANFPRLFESDVNEWDVANKVSDLLLQSMDIDVCCTAAPLTGRPDYGGAARAAAALVPTAELNGFTPPESSVDKYLFLQKALDGRTSLQDLNAAVRLTLGCAPLAPLRNVCGKG
jgi:hypothetical protein